MSLVTLSIAQCALRSSSRSSPVGAVGRRRRRALRAARRRPRRPSRHSRPRKRCTPSTPSSRPVGVLVGRADEQRCSSARCRRRSARRTASGEITLPLDLDIFAPSRVIMPWVKSARERLLDVQVAHVGERLDEEARVEQVQDRVLDAADVLVDRHPAGERPPGPTAPRRCARRSSAGSTRTSRRTCPSCRSRAAPGAPQRGHVVLTQSSAAASGERPLRRVVLDVGQQRPAAGRPAPARARTRRSGRSGSGSPSSAGGRAASRAGGS